MDIQYPDHYLYSYTGHKELAQHKIGTIQSSLIGKQ